MRRRKLLAAAAVVCALSVPVLLFFVRAPVLVVTDAPFIALHGMNRLRQQRLSASLALFRQVKPVMVADGASPDVVAIAVTEASAQPWCVLFARSHAMPALRFHELFPEIPAALLGGLVPVPEIRSPDGFLCVYGTDREADLFRAGLLAGILGRARRPAPQAEDQEAAPLTYALWQDRFVQAPGRDIFTRGVREEDPEAVVIFARTAAEIPESKDLACVVLTGGASEFLEKNPKVPQILFSWLDPAMTSREVMVQFDDSAWALAVPAVRMAVQKQAEGKIPSKPLIFSAKIADNSIARALQKSAKKTP